MPAPPDAPVLFGVLNVTPDSFSDGGRHLDPAAAVAHGLRLAADGADLVDVGGESTRPGAAEVPEAEELTRVLPVVRGLVAAGIRVSIDTRRASVAQRAVDAGAVVVNDVDGGTGDPAMLPVVAATGADYVVMHSRGQAGSRGGYADVVAEVRDDLDARLAAAVAAGIAADRLIADPGIGFSKTAEENWLLLSRLDAVRPRAARLLVGVSRKRFLGELVPGTAEDRDPVTAVLSALLAERGVWGLRVHDVAGTRAALEAARRMRAAA